MKTKIFLLSRTFLLLSMSVVISSGCGKDNGGKIWDISSVVVQISVVDAQGNDLLNPKTLNALDLSKIKAVYEGVDYECNVNASAPKSKAYLPHFYGLRAVKNDYYKVYMLNFGEFDGATSYKNKSVIIVWPDGTSDKISFNRDFRWKSNGDPKSKQEWFLNDTKASGLIQIVK